MTKQEFEKLIGKFVDYDTFELYERMYSATELTKDEFVKLLNIKAIQEDSEIAELRQELLQSVELYNERLQEAQSSLEQWQEWAKGESPSSFEQRMVRSCKNNVAFIKNYLRHLKADIKALKP